MPTTIAGRHFLQTPGPTNIPDRVLRAMDRNAINHRGPEFGALGREVVVKLRRVLQTEGIVAIFPASGTGAWESAFTNTLSPGDKVLASRFGQSRPSVVKESLRCENMRTRDPRLLPVYGTVKRFGKISA